MVKRNFSFGLVWFGFFRVTRHEVGQKRLIFIRGNPSEYAKVAFEPKNVWEKTFISNSHISGTKSPRHLNWV